MFKELSQSIRGYAKGQSTDSMKQYYNDIADALDDEEFLQILSNTEALDRLGYLRNDFNYYMPNRGNYHDALNTIYTNYNIYIDQNQSRLSVNFREKLEILKKKFKKAKKE